MKTLGLTLFASALALVAGCSSGAGSSPAPRVDDMASDGTGSTDIASTDFSSNDTASTVASLRRGPRHRPPSDDPSQDPCAAVRCAAGTSCVVVDGSASCEADTGINPCAAVLCAEGTSCEVIEGEAQCTPLEPVASAPFCGGIAAIECPGSGTCVDAPGDGCDPASGGADCGGVCECNIRALCIQGLQFDPSPEVCACVPAEPEVDACASVRCEAGTECVVVDDAATCQPATNPCAAVSCPVGSACEVVDGQGVCTPPEPAPFCGGFAGIECPGAGTCADDPSDDCDPDNGGADCGGVCQCFVRQLCIRGLHFDASPEVCECVPDVTENPCALVDCFPNQICEVQDGEAVCVPVDADGGHECSE
jgi:hypothetical protein